MKKIKKVRFIETSLGTIGIAEEDGAVTNIFFGDRAAPKEYTTEDTPVNIAAGEQLSAYFAGARRRFDFPMAPEGTAFQRAVWDALRAIPYGETRTYRQIAEQLGNPKATRAVGRANGTNPINIAVPCHRVIGADGTLTGYGGGLDRKAYLLRLEGVLP